MTFAKILRNAFGLKFLIKLLNFLRPHILNLEADLVEINMFHLFNINFQSF